MQAIDQVTLNFDPGAMAALNAIIALVIFGVALDLRLTDFRDLLRTPRALVLGFAAQFLYLPAVTLALVWLLQPPASIALGLFLVAACPSGNMSNFLTHHARGNVALSVSLTGAATVLAMFATPFNFALWSSLYPPTATLVRETSVATGEMMVTVLFLLVLPIVAGMLVSAFLPMLAARLRKPLRLASLVIFALFLVGALVANWQIFIVHVGTVAWLVFLHNALALAGGYVIAALGGMAEPERRAISIETGIQNSGLGLALVFAFFNGLGGMAIVAAWWGIWHLISGYTLASWFRSRPVARVAPV